MKKIIEAPMKEDMCANTNESDKSRIKMISGIYEVLKEYLSKDSGVEVVLRHITTPIP